MNRKNRAMVPEDRSSRGFGRKGSLVVVGGILLGGVALALYLALRMPGRSFRDSPPTTDSAMEGMLRRHVGHLAGEIGERNFQRYEALTEAADYIEEQFRKTEAMVSRQSYELDGRRFDNVIAEFKGAAAPEEVFVIGAHYDTVVGSPGANDNASGVAAILALASRFSSRTPAKTLRFVAFVNEETFFGQGPKMGSHVYASACRWAWEDIRGMLSLETIGYFSGEPGSQHYPIELLRKIYPDRGDFIAFVSNLSSRSFLRRTLGVFRRHGKIPSEGACLPEAVPGVGWSDHWSFWQAGYPALMVTDTAPFRYPWYHQREDTPDKIDYTAMGSVVDGLAAVIEDLAYRPE